jgi:hypothetical protein
MQLALEAVRQIRGASTRQVCDADVSLVIDGPMVSPVSSLIFALQEGRIRAHSSLMLSPRTILPQ